VGGDFLLKAKLHRRQYPDQFQQRRSLEVQGRSMNATWTGLAANLIDEWRR